MKLLAKMVCPFARLRQRNKKILRYIFGGNVFIFFVCVSVVGCVVSISTKHCVAVGKFEINRQFSVDDIARQCFVWCQTGGRTTGDQHHTQCWPLWIRFSFFQVCSEKKTNSNRPNHAFLLLTVCPPLHKLVCKPLYTTTSSVLSTSAKRMPIFLNWRFTPK